MHLQELAGNEIQRLAIVAHERQVGDARREHAPADELERELLDGHVARDACDGQRQGVAAGRLYYRHRRDGCGPGVQ
jgi:hypothetical protein